MCNELSDLERSISEKLTSFEARLDTIYMEMNSLRENQNEDNQSQTTQYINRLQAEAEQIRQKAAQLESLKSRCEMLSERYYSSASALMSSITTNASDGVSLMDAYMRKIEGIDGISHSVHSGAGGSLADEPFSGGVNSPFDSYRNSALKEQQDDMLSEFDGWPLNQNTDLVTSNSIQGQEGNIDPNGTVLQRSISDVHRMKIREGIRRGIVTEKDIRDIGRELRKQYDNMRDQRRHAYEEIDREQKVLALQWKRARNAEDRELIEARRKRLLQLENDYVGKYNTEKMVGDILDRYRPIGIGASTTEQAYLHSTIAFGIGKVINALNNVRGHIPTDWVEISNQKPIHVSHVSRGYFRPHKGFDEIALSGNEYHMRSCGYHEMGHRFENLIPEILEIERQFYNRRTAGYDLEWLGPGYKEEETTRKDNFISAYMGKDYQGTGFELLSMGLEALFCNTYDLSRDPEYEDLIFGILAAI